MITVFVKFKEWCGSPHPMLPDSLEIFSKIVEVEKLTDLNKMFDNILDVKVLDNVEKEAQDSQVSQHSSNEMLAEVPGGLNNLACSVYEKNCKKWKYPPTRNIGEILCLIHSEVSEALEADRKSRYVLGTVDIATMNTIIDDALFYSTYKKYIKHQFEEEMADIFIRLIDLCAYKGVDIESHVKAKLRFTFMNDTEGKSY